MPRSKATKRTGRLSKTDKTCHFFSLPPELRNRIYEHVLLDSPTTSQTPQNNLQPIKITKRTFSQPALLRTCKQIRTEATKIHYLNHTFTIPIKALNAIALHKFCLQSGFDYRTSPVPKIIIIPYAHAEPNWKSALQWLEWVFKGEAVPYHCDHVNKGFVCCMMRDMFKVVETLKICDWETQVKAVLKISKDSMMRQRRNSNVWFWH